MVWRRLKTSVSAGKKHECPQRIKLSNFDCNEVFNFCYATEEEVKKEAFYLKKQLGQVVF